MRELAAGGVQPNLNLGIIKAIEVTLPSIEEQTEIVRRIEAALTRIDRMVPRLQGRCAFGAVRGTAHGKGVPRRACPQDPNDEPASALLARIREDRVQAPKPKRRDKTKIKWSGPKFPDHPQVQLVATEVQRPRILLVTK